MGLKLKRAERKITGYYHNMVPCRRNGKQTVFCIDKNVWDTMWLFFKAKETRLCSHFDEKICSKAGCPQKQAHDRYMALLDKGTPNWVSYAKKNSLVQIVGDYREYRSLRKQLKQAQKDVEYSVDFLTREYGVEDDVNHGDACLKRKEIIEAENLFDKSACRFITSRCKFFTPIDDEGLCPNRVCTCWMHNRWYRKHLDRLQELTKQVSTFWSDKYARIK
jgi:hypothetical protein